MGKTASVLGTGIQGICVALMLQKHGYKVQLIDKNWDVMNRASLTREGKIHLGFIYGMDKSFRTGHRMVEDALHFAPTLDKLIGTNQSWDLLKAKKNVYLVTKDSMLTPEEVDVHFEVINSKFQDHLKDPTLHYLGSRPTRIFQKIPIPWYVDPNLIDAAYLTEEVSVDQPRIKELFKQKILNSALIELFLEHQVIEIKKKPNGYAVECKQKDGASKTFESDIVINCLWENRIYFDKLMGIDEEEIHSLRLKYGLVVKADEFLLSIDSANFIHGPLGSFVIHPNDDSAFFCWYPASMRGLMPYGALPESWEQICNGIIPKEEIDSLITDNFNAFKKFIPQLNKFDVIKVSAGVILAEGHKDIDKRESGFHTRIESPIRELDGYYSVSTSKFTSAPRNTVILENTLFPH